MPLRVYLSYETERHEYFIPDGSKVADVRNEVQSRFLLGQDDGKSDKKVVTLSYMGAELQDSWSFKDIGVLSGATIKIGEKEERRPRLYVYCSFNEDTVKIMDEIEVLKTTVAELRTLIARQLGIPVGVFRLATADGRELFDVHILDKYDIEIADTIYLHTWDGWTDFLNLCMMGYTSHVFAKLSEDEIVSKYQMKVAMHIACHYGHVDLALSLMKQGVRADDPVGYHPYRQWYTIEPHPESNKPPIHECAEQGQTALMRAMVNYDITVITCKNAYGKTPFQVALMGKQKATAGFLLGKQWSRIQYGPATLGITLPLNIYSKLKNWCERAKDRNYAQNGPTKSTLKRRPYITMNGTLVGIGVLVDGFTPSQMNGKSSPPVENKTTKSFLILPSDKLAQPPKIYFKNVLAGNKGNKGSRAKITTLPSRGVKMMKTSDCIIEEEENQSVRLITHQDAALSRLEEAAVEEIDYQRRMASLRATISRDDAAEQMAIEENGLTRESLSKSVEKSRGLPELVSKGSRLSFRRGKDAEGSYIETGKEENEEDKDKLKSKSKGRGTDKKDRMVISAMKKAKVKTTDSLIPLPLINTENSTKPYLLNGHSKEDDPALSTLALYEKYRGLKARDFAIRCLSVASNFKDKPWLQQVKLAMDLTSQEVKKSANSRSLDMSGTA